MAEALPCSNSSQFPEVHTSLQLSQFTQTSLTLYLAFSRVSRFLWHSILSSCDSNEIFQYTPGHEVLASSFTFYWLFYVCVIKILSHWLSSNITKHVKGLTDFHVPFLRTKQKNKTLFCLPNFKTLNTKVSRKNNGFSVLQFPSVCDNQFKDFIDI